MALLRMRWRGLFPALGLLLLLTLGLDPAAASDFGAIEDEFEKAIKLVSPCTVVCIAKDEDPRRVQATSGVVISRKGHILSDGEVICANEPIFETFAKVIRG